MNANEHENTIYFGYGEAEPFGYPTTDEDWAEYDREVAEEMARYDATHDDGWPEWDEGEPPF